MRAARTTDRLVRHRERARMWPWSCLFNIGDDDIRVLSMNGYNITVLGYRRTSPKGRAIVKGGLLMVGFVQAIFFAPEGGAEMHSVQAAAGGEGGGLEGDRDCGGGGGGGGCGGGGEGAGGAGGGRGGVERGSGG